MMSASHRKIPTSIVTLFFSGFSCCLHSPAEHTDQSSPVKPNQLAAVLAGRSCRFRFSQVRSTDPPRQHRPLIRHKSRSALGNSVVNRLLGLEKFRYWRYCNSLSCVFLVD